MNDRAVAPFKASRARGIAAKVGLLAAPVVILVFVPVPARADLIVADNFQNGFLGSSYNIGVGYTNNRDFSNEAAAQRFVAKQSGILTTITATVGLPFSAQEPLDVGFYTAPGHLPDVLLGALSVSHDAVAKVIGVGDFGTTFDFSALNISVQSGQSYAVTFTTAHALFLDDQYIALPMATNPNSFKIQPIYSPHGGLNWFDEGIPNEIGLVVRAKAIPEPVDLLLVLAGSLCVAARRRPPP